MNTSNWLDNQKRIMIGGKPYNENDIQYLLKNQITVIVNLTTEREIKHKNNYQYQKSLPSTIDYIHFPIKDMTTQPDNITLDLIDNIIKLINKHVIYIHCKGGHGRAGVIAGLLTHKLNPEFTYKEVIEYIQKQHRTRKIKPYVSTPQTTQQFNQIYRIMNINKNINPNTNTIFFYDSYSPYYVFSNFYTNPQKQKQKTIKPLFIDNQNREWYSSEAFYQAHKFIGIPDAVDTVDANADADASIDTDIDQDTKTYFEIIRNTPSSHFAYLLGNMGGNIRPNWKINGVPIKDIIKTYKSKIKIVSNWNDIKEDVMKQALMYKFNQNQELREILLQTKTKTNTNKNTNINTNKQKTELIEYSPRDTYWGTYWNKNGKNRLGILLENLRDDML